MSDGRKFYCLCEANCKFETMNKEQILAAIAEATGATVTDVDAAFITKVKESNANGNISFWMGTEAEFNALSPAVAASAFIARIDESGKVYICKDDSELKALWKAIDEKADTDELCMTAGSGAHSAQGGIDNQAISEATFTQGKGNFVGLKGYYYSNIDFTAKTITLSTKQNAADASGIQLKWAVGDKVSIVNNSHYDRCSTITAINGNVITVDAFPFTEVVVALSDWDDYCIFVPDKPEAGVVDLGRYATAIGEDNTATARAATAIGRENKVQSMYGVALGRSNTIKAYAGVALGRGNTIEAEALYGSADGVENTVTAPIAHAGGSNSKATADGADADGYKCEADGKWALSRNYKTKAKADYAAAFNEETSAEAKGSFAAGKGTKTILEHSAWFGKYNNPTVNHLFGVGMGTSDTARANAFVVRKDGDADFFGHRARNVANAVAETDAVNLRQLKEVKFSKQDIATHHYEGQPVYENVTTWLDYVLYEMPNHSGVTVSGYFFDKGESHISYGILYRHDNDHASLYTTSYVDEEWRIQKVGGVWQEPEYITRAKKEEIQEQAALISALQQAINTHMSDEGNPHNTTKSNLGLELVDNTADKDKSVRYAASAGSVPWSGVSGKPSLIGEVVNASPMSAVYTVTGDAADAHFYILTIDFGGSLVTTTIDRFAIDKGYKTYKFPVYTAVEGTTVLCTLEISLHDGIRFTAEAGTIVHILGYA